MNEKESTSGEKVRARVVVSGRVQGVFFRGTTQEMAVGLGLSGWVRNLHDGRVEAVFEGERAAVERAVRWCHDGPRSASVSDVEFSWEPVRGEREFRIRH